MSPADIERVFGRGRLKMVTGEHVEVFREAVLPGERRRYTKRFLNTRQGDFGHWTEREWRILARLIGHGAACVPEVVQYDRGRRGGVQMVQTYDAGVTVDQWATLLPVLRDGVLHRHVFEDCAHWWALAHHALVALDEIHALELVHLDVKGDNVCIPYAPSGFDPHAPEARLQPLFRDLALIDFAFALISRERLTTPLPIGWQRDYDYQSPRLLAALAAGRNGDLQPTRELDWRCDMYSLAAMLERYLSAKESAGEASPACGWTRERRDAANALVARLRAAHDGDLPRERPHRELIALTGARLAEAELAGSLAREWTLAPEAALAPAPTPLATPATLLAPSVHVVRSGRATAVTVVAPHAAPTTLVPPAAPRPVSAPATPVVAEPPRPPDSANERAPARRRPAALAAVVAAVAIGVAAAYLAERMRPAEPAQLPAYADDPASPPEGGPAAAGNGALARIDVEPPRAQAPSAAGDPNVSGRAAASAPNASATAPDTARAPAANAMATASETAAAPAPNASATATAPDRAAPPALRSPAPAARAGFAAPAARAPAAANPAAAAANAVAVPGAAAGGGPAPSARRPLPSWVSLEPPAWLRTGKAPTPPGAGQESRSATLAAAAPKPPADVAAPVRSSRIDGAPTGAAPADMGSTPSVRGDVPAVPFSESAAPGGAAAAAGPSAPAAASASAASPPTALAPEPAPAAIVSPPPTASPSEHRKSSPVATFRRWLFGSSIPAPIEERSAPRKPAPASADAAGASSPRLADGVAPSPRLADGVVPSPRLADGVVPALPNRLETAELGRPPLPSGYPPPPRPLASAADDAHAPLDYAAQGRRAVTETVPWVAAKAEAEVSRVLALAANANSAAQDRVVAEAARATRVGDIDAVIDPRAGAPREARRLNDEARVVWSGQRNVSDAYRLQLEAFGANPRDPEVAGNLALYHLWLRPPQPDKARQLALFALTARNPEFHTARMEDWTTFAIASALAGREADATRALFVTLALSGNVERRCVAALDALAAYGERLRAPVEAMFARVRDQRRGIDSPACSWPSGWVVRRLS